MKRIGKKGSGEFERISWDEAYRMIAENLLRIKKNMVRRRQHFMRDIRNGTDRHFCGLPMLTGLRITVRIQYLFQSAAMAWRSIYGNDICFPDLMQCTDGSRME